MRGKEETGFLHTFDQDEVGAGELRPREVSSHFPGQTPKRTAGKPGQRGQDDQRPFHFSFGIHNPIIQVN
jgi:hypothetical protein